jgi:peptidoglycan/LPS O-acetylase OafA/YrhL
MMSAMSIGQSRPAKALVALDLLRFAAAMMVLAFHYWGKWRIRIEYGLGPTPADQLMPSNGWLQAGWVGVEIFFLISGYVIAMSANSVDAGTFARKRWLRLWPAAFVCASITAFTLWTGGLSATEIWPPWMASAFLVPVNDQIDGVYWTLGIECAFYLLVAILLWLKCWRPVPFAVALSLWSVAHWAGAVGWTGLANLTFDDPMANLGLGRYGAFFALGILIEAAHRRDPLFRSWMIVPSLLAMPLCIAWHSATQRADIAPAAIEIEPHLMFAAGLAIVALAPAIQQRVRSATVARIAVALGLATYPLYLLHHYVGECLLLLAVHNGVPGTVAVWPVTAAMIGLALFVALKIEPPIRRLLGQLLDFRSLWLAGRAAA